jgi:hypothetical protein
MTLWRSVKPNTKIGDKIDDMFVLELKKEPSFLERVCRANAIQYNKNHDKEHQIEIEDVGPDLLLARLGAAQLELKF